MGNFLPWYFVVLFSSHFSVARECRPREDRTCEEGELPAGTPPLSCLLHSPHRSATNFRIRFVFLAAEPIIMEGSPEFKILKDKWTAISVDNKRCLILFFWSFLSCGTDHWQPEKRTGEFNGHGGHACPLITAKCAFQISAVWTYRCDYLRGSRNPL